MLFFVSLLFKVPLLQDGMGRVVIREFCGKVAGAKVADGKVAGGKVADGKVAGGKVAGGKVAEGKVASSTAKQTREINICTWVEN